MRQLRIFSVYLYLFINQYNIFLCFIFITFSSRCDIFSGEYLTFNVTESNINITIQSKLVGLIDNPQAIA